MNEEINKDVPGQGHRKPKWRTALWVIGTIAILYSAYQVVFSPHTNSNPTQRILLHGAFPFDKGLSVDFYAAFYSRNPTCRVLGRAFLLFPTAEVDRRTIVNIQTRQVAPNKYEAEVFLDHIKPGFCDWEYGGMGYRIHGGKFQSTAYQGLGLDLKKTKLAEFACKELKIVPPMIKPAFSSYYCGEKTIVASEETLSSSELNFIWTEE